AIKLHLTQLGVQLLGCSPRACWGATRAVLPAFSHVRSA
ncbi:hypothetical protein ACGI0C_27535, partial [Klebsiella pneumoniae]